MLVGQVPKTKTDVSENVVAAWQRGEMPGGRQVGRSAERCIQVGGPGGLPSDVGSPHVEGQCALSRSGEDRWSRCGGRTKAPFEPLRLRVC